jgi:hypothetical protein
MSTQRPIDIFFSYAHEDERLMHAVRHQLVVFDRLGLIRKKYDRLIQPGSEWSGQIHADLTHADIVLLFLSPDFLASDYCYETEMREALRRHHEGATRVIPIIVRPCPWRVTPLANLQALPKDALPLTQWPDRDEACLDVAQGIMRVVHELRGESFVSAEHAATPVDGRRLAVRVHRAFFDGHIEECHFINLTNTSAERVLEVTHVWYEDDSHHIPIVQATRPLPVRLELDQAWETWIPTAALPREQREDALSRFRARISTGTVFSSVANRGVPPFGFVPGDSAY